MVLEQTTAWGGRAPVDGDVIDGSLNGVALGIVPFFTKLAGRWQSGYVFTYAFAMVLGIAALLTWMTLTVGH